jgi:hypothetical protein
MKLLDYIRTDRERRKGRKALPETAFTVVAAMVKKFKVESVPGGEAGRAEYPATSPSERLSLFPLLSAAQLRLTMEIIDTYNNPYLVYARSTEDFGVSLSLYECNPDLEPENLEQYSLGWLLIREQERRG